MAVANYRRYTFGTIVSQAGSWLELTGELWAISTISHSGLALGLHSALRFGPIAIFGMYGGVISDRLDRRHLLLLTQALLLVSALAISAGWAVGWHSLILIYAVVLVQGLVNAVDNPLRRTFIRDLADDEVLANAIGLEGAFSTVARTVGPGMAGIVITLAGVGWCFYLNVFSYVAVLVSVLLIDPTSLRPSSPVARGKGQVREGLRYAFRSPPIMQTLSLSAIVSAFGWNWQALLPLYSSASLHGDAAQFGLLISILSIGALVGALIIARVLGPTTGHLALACLAVVVALSLTAVAPNVVVAGISLALLGLAGTVVNISSQTRLQLIVDDGMAGRLMALYSICWLGTRPIGGMVGGFLTDSVSPRGAFLVGAAVVAAASFLPVRTWRRERLAAAIDPADAKVDPRRANP